MFPAFRLSGLRRLTLAATALLSCTLMPTAHAELGGSVDSVGTDMQRMQASRRIISATAYTRHLMTTATGTEVSEYVSADGTVFAVSWVGPFKPDLEQLLGSYFSDYVTAANAQGPSRRAVSLQRADLVVHSGGHMRAFIGRAYLPEKLPSGVSTDDIR